MEKNYISPRFPTTIETMGVNITTIAYIRVLIIEIGSTIILMVVEAQGIYSWKMDVQCCGICLDGHKMHFEQNLSGLASLHGTQRWTGCLSVTTHILFLFVFPSLS